MATDGRREGIDLTGSVAAFGRIAYSDLLTIVLVSVLFTAFSLPLVTVGAAILALVETVTAVTTGEGRGGPTKERERGRLFLDSFRRNLRRGLPYSLAFFAVLVTTLFYVLAALDRASGFLLLGGLVGVYAVVIAFAWLLRAASIQIRTTNGAGFVAAARDGALLALEQPSYTVLQLITGGAILLFAFAFPFAYVLVVPGLLATLEVVSFEETDGRGAMALVRAYRGELKT